MGVPETAQVEAASDKPVGSAGDDEQLVIVPPDALGVFVEIALPAVALIVEGE